MVDAAPDGRRPRQLRLPRRPARRDALHRVPDGARGGGDDRLDQRGHGRLQAQLRRPRDRAVGAALGDPQPAGQRHHRDRGRHGHQHGPAQPGRGGPGAAPPDQGPDGHRRRPDAVHPGAGPAHGRQDRRPRGHPRRLRDRPRQLPDAGQRPGRLGERATQGNRRDRAALRRGHRARHRADQGARPDQEAPGDHQRRRPHRRREGPPARDRGQERLPSRGAPRAALQADADGGVLRHQQRRAGRRPAAHARAQADARGVPRSPARRRTPPFAAPPHQGRRRAPPGRGAADRDPRHRRGDPADPRERQRERGARAADNGLRPERAPGQLHPRHGAAAADEVLAARARLSQDRARADHRGARRDPGRRDHAAPGGLRRAGRGREDLRHPAPYRPARGVRPDVDHGHRARGRRRPVLRSTSPPPACSRAPAASTRPATGAPAPATT